MKSRIVLIFSVFLLLWVVLLGRGAELQLLPNKRLATLKRRQFETSVQIRTRRGAILDRTGAELAASIPSYSLYADPKVIHRPSHWAWEISHVLRIPYSTTLKRMTARSRRFVWIYRRMPEALKKQIQSWSVHGLSFIEEPKRVYPNGPLLAQVLGFVGMDGEGLDGLELQYDKYLRGHLKRVIMPRDAHGRPLLKDGRALSEVPDGADLELTIDNEVQYRLERELSEVVSRFQAHSAVGVVMDAQTSEILAMANVPTVNFNDSLRYPAEKRRDRVVTDAFEPGSTMKSFLISGALSRKIIKPSTQFYCEGGHMKVDGHWISEAETKEKFKWLDVTEILAHSSNVGAAKIAFKLGAANLRQTLLDFGFGAKTGVGLPGESSGILNPLPWRRLLLSNVAFGQGVAVTPLQIAMAYTAIANGGELRQPLLVKAIHTREPDKTVEFEAKTIRRVLSPQDAATMRLMLSAATGKNGTGAAARIPGYFVAGKTGTAQMVDSVHGGYKAGAYVSSFAGFVPATKPRYVIYIAVSDPHKGYYGAQVAAPAFAEVAQYLARRAGLPPVEISENNVISSKPAVVPPKKLSALQEKALQELRHMNADSASLSSSSLSPDTLPDLVGMSLRQGLELLGANAANVQVRGHGRIVRTFPTAGSHLATNARVTLILDNP